MGRKKKWFENKTVEWYEGYFSAMERSREHWLEELQTIGNMLGDVVSLLNVFKDIQETMKSEKTVVEEKPFSEKDTDTGAKTEKIKTE